MSDGLVTTGGECGKERNMSGMKMGKHVKEVRRRDRKRIYLCRYIDVDDEKKYQIRKHMN